MDSVGSGISERKNCTGSVFPWYEINAAGQIVLKAWAPDSVKAMRE